VIFIDRTEQIIIIYYTF